MESKQLEQALSRAVEALKNVPEKALRKLTIQDCALMLAMLPADSKLTDLRAFLAKRLLAQLSPTWIRGGDLFEVFFALTALWQYGQTRVTADHLVCAVQRLISSEAAVGGPYYSGDTVEFAANLQVARFTRLAAGPLPGVDVFLNNALASGHYNSAASPLYILYLAATIQSHPGIIRSITKYQTASCGHRALALAVLKNDVPLHRQALRFVCSAQQPTGLWNAELLIEGSPRSPIVTTAFIVGMLTRYQQNLPSSRSSTLKKRQKAVAKVARQQFAIRAEPLRSSALAAVDKVCKADASFEITLLSYLFSQAIKEPPRLGAKQYALLGAASVCGWVAYTIYDDLLDGEGSPAHIPIANVAMRASLDCFRETIPTQEKFQRYVIKVFAEMDEANAWEAERCRFTIKNNMATIKRYPHYGKCGVLAARSFAYALGPLAVLSQHPAGSSKKIRSIESAFRHYLIARQLCDDIHDWQDDLQAGLASYVVTAILRDMRLQPGTYDLSFLLPAMQKRFRRTTFTQVSLLALSHIHKARQCFRKYDSWQTSSGIDTFLDNLEASLVHSLDQHKKAHALTKI